MTVLSRLAGAGLLAALVSATGLQALLADTNPHLADTPADTVFHYQVRLADVIATQSLAGSVQNQMLFNAAQDMDDEDMLLFQRLQSELESGDGLTSLDSAMGIDPEGWISIYHTGLVGVVRVDLTSAERLLDWMSAEDLLPESAPPTNAGTGTLYPLNNDPSMPIHSHIWVDQDRLQFLLTPAAMTSQQLVQRLELSSEGASLADSNQVDDLLSQYSLTGSDFWWFDFAGLARALLEPNDRTLSRDLKRYVPEYRAIMNEPETATCAADLIEMAEATPRLLWGQTGLSLDDNELNVDMHGVLELSDPELRQELSGLEGSLPADLGQVDNSLMRLGLALNVDQLGDALLTWRNRAINAEWTCPALLELQADLSGINMAGVLAGTGMLQGTQGLVVEVFGMDMQAPDELQALDGLLAIQADNPQRLAMMLAEALEMPPGFRVPSSGESAVLPLPDISLRVRISGSYLVVYNGEQAAQRALALGEVEHRAALAAFAVDGPAFMQHLDDMPMLQGAQPATGGMSMGNTCESIMNTTDLFSHLDILQVGSWLGMNPSGLSVTQSLRARSRESANAQIQPGRYQLAYYEDCTWFDIGEDYLGADGQAEYTEIEGNCSVFEERFEWEADSHALIWGPREARDRNSCEDEFSPWQVMEEEPVRCEVVRMEPDGSFQCISPGSYGERYRYRRLN